MLDAKRFDLINTVCQTLRRKPNAFGGLQIVLCGDFFQLPPVPARGQLPPDFCFVSKAWADSNIIVCYLEKQYRQNDLNFLETLNAIRGNRVTEITISTLEKRNQQSIIGFPKPTRLYTHNSHVEAINSFELKQLQSKPIHYHMTWSGEPELVAELRKSCLAPNELILKKGALVMFVKNNFDMGYVNGTLGIVVDFDKDDNNPIIEIKNGKKVTAGPVSWTTEDEEGGVLARISQVPLRLAWAITVHKSQGMSLDCAEIDLSKAFTEGMGYVALSRVRALSGIKLMGLNKMALEVNSVITELDTKLIEMSNEAKAELDSLDDKKKKDISKAFLLR
jgi:hypothetical protein